MEKEESKSIVLQPHSWRKFVLMEHGKAPILLPKIPFRNLFGRARGSGDASMPASIPLPRGKGVGQSGSSLPGLPLALIGYIN